ncbi:MAG: M56 family metallopeptidase [Planctomycetota bacterium]|jgi:beta-lactamase regulating signal transducer with metallopeptidase domain
MIEQINNIAALWWSGMIAMIWQVGVLIILIGCVDLIIRRWAWPQLRYALWLMVLIKLVLPPTISLSTSITSGLQPLAKQIVAKESHEENMNATTAMILANLQAATAEPAVVATSSGDIVTEQQPAFVFTSPENVAGESANAAYVQPTWQAYTMAIWLIGMFILGGWLIIKLLHLRKEDRPAASTASLPASFYDSMAQCAERLELHRVPKVVQTRRVACPAVFGMVRPVLLMPVGYLSKMTRRDTENMLLHELAHIKRGDLWVHGFYMLLQIVYWYNPLLWLVRSQMHHLRELCCDATVARLLKDKTNEYRQTLIDVARRYLTKPTEPGLGLLGLFEDSNRLLVRLNWLKKETWRYQKMKKLTIITTIILMLAFVLPMAQAQDKSSTEESNADSVLTEEQSSESTASTKDKQEQFLKQQQLSQTMQALQKQLQALEIEKQKLQHQIHALEHSQHTQQHAEHAKHAEHQAAQVKIKAKEAKEKAEKAKLEIKAKQFEQQALKMKQWAQQYAAQFNSPEFQKQIDNLENNAMVQWANSDEFKQWQKEMKNWSQQWAESDEFKQ